LAPGPAARVTLRVTLQVFCQLALTGDLNIFQVVNQVAQTCAQLTAHLAPLGLRQVAALVAHQEFSCLKMQTRAFTGQFLVLLSSLKFQLPIGPGRHLKNQPFAFQAQGLPPKQALHPHLRPCLDQ
jgi:hypothetical protein